MTEVLPRMSCEKRYIHGEHQPEAVMVSRVFESIWSLRQRRNDQEPPPGFKYKRRMPRHVGPFTAKLYQGFSQFSEPAVVRDINELGLFFWSEARLPLRAECEIAMELPPQMRTPDRTRVRLKAVVIRVQDGTNGDIGTAAIIKGCTILADAEGNASRA
jgi:hypothetical protein